MTREASFRKDYKTLYDILECEESLEDQERNRVTILLCELAKEIKYQKRRK